MHAVPSDLVAEAKYGDKACSAEQLAYRAALDAKKKGHKLLDDTEDDADQETVQRGRNGRDDYP